MKRLITVLVALFVIVSVVPAHAETVSTCSSVYGGGEVCGETTTNVTVEHQTVNTAINDNQALMILASVLGAALLATALYKLTYKLYIFG
jgi:putative cell wall-binding protein